MIITAKDRQDGEKIGVLFEKLSETSRLMVISYLSALRDKELVDAAFENDAEINNTLKETPCKPA